MFPPESWYTKIKLFSSYFLNIFLLENIPLTCGVVHIPVQYNHSRNVFTLKNYLFNIQKLDFSVTCTLRYNPPRSVFRNKKRKKIYFSIFFINISLEPVLRLGDDNTKNGFIKKVFHGMIIHVQCMVRAKVVCFMNYAYVHLPQWVEFFLRPPILPVSLF